MTRRRSCSVPVSIQATTWRSRVLLATLFGLVAGGLLALSTTTFAAALEPLPPRSLGMGGALRGAATGDAGPTLNPSGMSLVRSYTVEGAYQNMNADAANIGHISIVDSTSGFNLGGGVYYTYASAAPKDAPAYHRHEAGVALSFPFGDRVTVGGTVRYLRAYQDAFAGSTPLSARTDKGITFDAGVTIRPVPILSLGLVGYGLRDQKNPQAPLAAGGGLAFVPIPELIIAFDGVVDFRTYDKSLGKAQSFMGGAEYTLGGHYAFRGGGGHDGLRKHGYGSAGVSLVSDVGAIDIGARQDVSGIRKGFYIGVAGRLFVPAP